MPARDVERLIDQAQRRLARCFACGTDGAFPATITSHLGRKRQHPRLDPHLRGLLGPGHAARGEGDRWVGRPRPTTGVTGGRRIRRTGSGSASVVERDDGPATARRRAVAPGSSSEPVEVSTASAADLGAGPRRGPRPRGRSDPPIGRALSRRRRRDPPRPARAAGPGRPSHRLAPGRALLAPPPRAAARGRLMVDGSLTRLRLSGLRAPRRRLRLAHDERAALRPLRPSGLRQPLPAHARPSGAADAAPGDGWRSGRSRPTSRATAGAARAGIASRTRSDPASSRPTIRCRSSSVASRCRLGPACSARAATRARG